MAATIAANIGPCSRTVGVVLALPDTLPPHGRIPPREDLSAPVRVECDEQRMHKWPSRGLPGSPVDAARGDHRHRRHTQRALECRAGCADVRDKVREVLDDYSAATDS